MSKLSKSVFLSNCFSIVRAFRLKISILLALNISAYFSARKSAVFPKRPSNENQGHSNNNVNDKENNKPMVGSKPLKIDTTTTSSTLEKSGKIINQEPPKSPKPKLPNVEDKPKLPVEEKPQEIREIKTPPVIGWKPLQSQSSVTSLSSVNSLTSPVEENKSETKNWKTSNVETKTEKMSLEERVNIFSKNSVKSQCLLDFTK